MTNSFIRVIGVPPLRFAVLFNSFIRVIRCTIFFKFVYPRNSLYYLIRLSA